MENSEKGNPNPIPNPNPKPKPKPKQKTKHDQEENNGIIYSEEYFNKLFEGRSKLHKIGYTFLLAELHKRAGDKNNRTETFKANPDIVKAACNIIKEDLGIKDFEDQIEMAFLLVLYIAR